MDRIDLFQNKTVMSVPREAFLFNMVTNDGLSKKDLRVALLLMTVLNGYNKDRNTKKEDPMNFKAISVSKISDELGYDKKDVKKSIKTLITQGILEQGDGLSVTDGYRFTF